MPDFPIGRFRGVGSQKSKGKIKILVLHQMEENPLRHMEMLILFCQVHLHGSAVEGNLSAVNLQQPAEDGINPFRVYVLCPDGKGHRFQQRFHVLGRNLQLHFFSGQLQLRQAGQALQKSVRQQTQESFCGGQMLSFFLESHLVKGVVFVRFEAAPPALLIALESVQSFVP